MSKVIPSGQIIHVPTPVVVLDDAFLSRLESLTELQFSAELRHEIERALKAYVAAYHLHAAASRPAAIKPALEQMRKLSARLADLIEWTLTHQLPVNAAVLLVGQADDEADDSWRSTGDPAIRDDLAAAYRQHFGNSPPVENQPRAERSALDWQTLAKTLRRIEQAARHNLENDHKIAVGCRAIPIFAV